MGYYYKWRPSKADAREFAEKMKEIEKFCAKNNIHQSANGDSYYFMLNGTSYRVSNHSVESSPYYHPLGREKDEVYIHASKTRIIEIFNDLEAGYTLDGNGRRK